eukprot:gene29138-42742_t
MGGCGASPMIAANPDGGAPAGLDEGAGLSLLHPPPQCVEGGRGRA